MKKTAAPKTAPTTRSFDPGYALANLHDDCGQLRDVLEDFYFEAQYLADEKPESPVSQEKLVALRGQFMNALSLLRNVEFQAKALAEGK